MDWNTFTNTRYYLFLISQNAALFSFFFLGGKDAFHDLSSSISSFAYIHDPQTLHRDFLLQNVVNNNIFITLRRRVRRRRRLTIARSFHPERNQILSPSRQLFMSQPQLFH